MAEPRAKCKNNCMKMAEIMGITETQPNALSDDGTERHQDL
jgi:hypothetical protein